MYGYTYTNISKMETPSTRVIMPFRGLVQSVSLSPVIDTLWRSTPNEGDGRFIYYDYKDVTPLEWIRLMGQVNQLDPSYITDNTLRCYYLNMIQPYSIIQMLAEGSVFPVRNGYVFCLGMGAYLDTVFIASSDGRLAAIQATRRLMMICHNSGRKMPDEDIIQSLGMQIQEA